jgi:hypothetical protein
VRRLDDLKLNTVAAPRNSRWTRFPLLGRAEAGFDGQGQQIPGDSNEVGTIHSTVQTLLNVYGATSMVQVVMTDAGNTRCATASFLTEKKVDYLLAIADNHPDILNEAQSLFGVRTNDQAEATSSENPDGLSVVHGVWTTLLPLDSCGGVMPDNLFEWSVAV